LIDVKFLVVDDSANARKSIRRVIELLIGSKKVVEAADGMEALSILATEDIDFIIADWEMPNLSGGDLLIQVRNAAKTKTIPFIMATAHTERDFLITSLQEGVSNYLIKPFTAKELEEKIRRSWSGANRRSTDRYFMLPEHTAHLISGKKSWDCQMINISRTGSLIQLEYSTDLELLKNYELRFEMELKDSDKPLKVDKIRCKATRIELDDAFRLTDHTCSMALWFGANTMPETVLIRLTNILTWLKGASPDMIDDKDDIDGMSDTQPI